MEENEQLWKFEDGYPPLCFSESRKEELLRDEDFTDLDNAARTTHSSLKESFDKLVQHLTSHLNSDLRKLRSICVWMGAQNIGCQQEDESCSHKGSPKYFLWKAKENRSFIAQLFAKLCRSARIPCILVNGKAKDVSYDPGDDDIQEDNTWAIVYVAGSWRFVFPLWAFVKVGSHQKRKWMLLEDCGKHAKERMTANESDPTPDFDEFYFLTNPEVMNCFCHPEDNDKQLLTVPWTKEKFYDLPHFKKTYFTSGWQLTSPMTGLIKPVSGCCCVDFWCPPEESQLYCKLFFDEGLSGKAFPEELQFKNYVYRLDRGAFGESRRKSLVIRLPMSGTYKLEVTDIHRGRECSLVQFRIVCDSVPETRPFPNVPDILLGFGEAAAEAGLSDPSHTEGLVPVKSGEEIEIEFKIKDDTKISARLVHSTRAPMDVQSQKEADKVTLTIKLPEDDPTPEYSLEIGLIKNVEGTDGSQEEITNILNYLLTSDKTLHETVMDRTKQTNLQCYKEAYDALSKHDERLLEKAFCRIKMIGLKDPILDEKLRAIKAKYKRMRQEVLAAAEEKDLDGLNLALGNCMAVNLEYRGDVEATKEVLLGLCNDEVQKVFKNLKLQELQECLDKVAKTCVGNDVQEEGWFQKAQQVSRDVQELEQTKLKAQSLRDDDIVSLCRPPDQIISLLVATFIMLGERQEGLDTWQNIWATMHQTSKEQLLLKMGNFDDYSLTQEQVDLAEKKLQESKGNFGDDVLLKYFNIWCLDRIKFYRFREKLARRA